MLPVLTASREGPARSPPALHRRPQLAGLPPRPPSSTGSGVGRSSYRTTPLRRRSFIHLVKRFGGGPRSSPDPRGSWAPSTPSTYTDDTEMATAIVDVL